MSKTVKQLRRENNIREQDIAPENKEIYMNMIVYISGSKLTDRTIQEIRADITEMMLDAQHRGDNIQQVFGENYKEICDDIIEAMPKKTVKDHLLEIVDITLRCIWILGTIAFFMSITTDLASQQGLDNFNVTSGQTISMLLIILFSYGFVTYVSKTALNQDESKKQTILEIAGFLFAITLATLPIMIFDTIVLEVTYLTALLVIGLIFGLSKLVDNRR